MLHESIVPESRPSEMKISRQGKAKQGKATLCSRLTIDNFDCRYAVAHARHNHGALNDEIPSSFITDCVCNQDLQMIHETLYSGASIIFFAERCH